MKADYEIYQGQYISKGMKFSRQWAMPTKDTFTCPPIGEFVARWMCGSMVSVDPFACNSEIATHRNDLNPYCRCDHHLDARDFLKLLHSNLLRANGTGNLLRADRLLLDPPYSSRQISECYSELGISCGMESTQNGAFYKQVRDAGMKILAPGAVVLSFGWNSSGMGIGRGFEVEEIMLVCHGGAHNDTICIAERQTQPELLFSTI